MTCALRKQQKCRGPASGIDASLRAKRSNLVVGMASEALSLELPARPESARTARELVAEFRDRLDASDYGDLRLVVSELVADAVRAKVDGAPAVRVGIEVRGRWIRAEVSDGAGAAELKSRHPVLGGPGWGIHLARVLGHQWGSTHEAERRSIWVEMERSGDPSL
jgi:hypothetical protein